MSKIIHNYKNIESEIKKRHCLYEWASAVKSVVEFSYRNHRNLRIFKIGNGKQTLFISGGLSGEYTTSMLVIELIDYFIANKSLLEEYKIFFTPFMSYEFVHNNSQVRVILNKLFYDNNVRTSIHYCMNEVERKVVYQSEYIYYIESIFKKMAVKDRFECSVFSDNQLMTPIYEVESLYINWGNEILESPNCFKRAVVSNNIATKQMLQDALLKDEEVIKVCLGTQI